MLAGLVADGLGLAQIPCTKVEGACASGGIVFRHAYLAVSSGLCDVALSVGVEKMTHADTATTTAALNCAMDNRSDGVSGLTFPGLFGLAWQVHAERYGTRREQVSAVVTKNKANGLLNPLAQMGGNIDNDQIVQSALICDPLRLYDCCPTSDGAAALLLVAADRRSDLAAMPVEVMASAQTRGSARIAGHPDLCSFEATVAAAQMAYAQAGITAGDIDLVELHDCFSIAEIIDGEDFGLMPRGHGAAYAVNGPAFLEAVLMADADIGLGTGTHQPLLADGRVREVAQLHSRLGVGPSAALTPKDFRVGATLDNFILISAPQGLAAADKAQLIDQLSGAVNTPEVQAVIKQRLLIAPGLLLGADLAATIEAQHAFNVLRSESSVH